MSRLTNLLALFQDALAVRGWAVPEYRRQYTPTGRISRNYRPTQRTAAERHWHNPADPVQSARIQAAVSKRERKAKKLDHDSNNAWAWNFTHNRSFGSNAALNPFYISK